MSEPVTRPEPGAPSGREPAWEADQEQLRLLVDAVLDYAILTLDPQGNVTSWNSGAQRLKGYLAEEIVGRHFSVFYPPEDVASGKPQRALEIAARQGRIEDEGWRVRKDGSRFWANVVITALRTPAGKLVGYGKVTRDLTERHQSELALRAAVEETEIMDKVFTDAPAGVALIGMDRRFVRVNAALCEFLGRSEEEIIGSTSESFTHPDDLALTEEAYRNVSEGAPIVRMEKRYLRPDGSVVWGATRASALASGAGQPAYLVAHVRDITAQRRVEEQLRHEESRLRQLLEGAPDAMIIADADGLIQSVNERALQLFGYAREELLGASVELLVPPAARRAHARLRAAFVKRPDVREMAADRRLTAVHRDGTEIPVSITLSLVRTDDEVVVLAAVRDITVHRAQEERLRAAEEQFRRSFEDAPIGMMVTALDGHYIDVNDAFAELLGYTRAELVGLKRQSITHPDDLRRDDDALADLLSGAAKSLTWEKRFIHAAGHPVWTSISVTVIRDGEGNPSHLITQVEDITERRRYESQLRYMADHDPLTGLLNRRSFERELTSHVARVKRFGASGSVLMIDLDNFKYYNDTQGHSAGDALIIRIGKALQTRLRETDVLARLGGDEFAVLLTHEDAEAAEAVARSVLEVVRAEVSGPTRPQRRHVTASIGIACFSDAEALGPEEILVNADLAMYDAKEQGRNRISRYRTDQHERPRIESQMKWATEIADALSQERFELVAQPIEPFHSNGRTQFELLLRMRTVDGDLIPPGTFIYIAERLGLIQEIDRWVVAQAIDMLAAQRGLGRDLRFEVNLSGHTIGDPELLELIERRLRETGVSADQLVFEITETAAVANIARAAAFAHSLSALGCRFALDDFGAGFGSFYYLKHLPFDYLKIDGEFVRDCATNETDRILIASVVSIARGMGKHTIAEFVGDEQSVEVLAALGVDFGQGYFLGRPEPLANHLERLEARRRSPDAR